MPTVAADDAARQDLTTLARGGALNLAGAVVTTTAVAALGFAVGQTAIDIVLLVDRYAGWVSLALVVLLLLTPALRRARSRGVRRTRPAAADGDVQDDRDADGVEGDVGHPFVGARPRVRRTTRSAVRYLSSFDIRLSANGLPPVWHVAQY